MWNHLLSVAVVCALAGCSAVDGPASPAVSGRDDDIHASSFGAPLAGLSAALQSRFSAGATAFATTEDVADGLGPVFNDTSCGACHAAPALGGGSTRVETRFGTITAGAFDPLTALGGSLIQSRGIGAVNGCNVSGEVVPPQATIVAGRRTTPLFGLGLVDAVAAQTLSDLASAQVGNPDGVHGRVAMVADLSTQAPAAGRFGWKAQEPTLAQFAADAYLNEMGITSPLFPTDNCPQGNCALQACDGKADPEDDGTDVAEFADFMTLLAPPPVQQHTGAAKAGEELFLHTGCATCHVPDLETAANPIPALSKVTFHPYSDFLLHDMGTLGDGIAQGAAGPREMRTAPLWGIGKLSTFLHDGSATTLEAAVLAHDGEAATASKRFAAMSTEDRSKIIAFLQDL